MCGQTQKCLHDAICNGFPVSFFGVGILEAVKLTWYLSQAKTPSGRQGAQEVRLHRQQSAVQNGFQRLGRNELDSKEHHERFFAGVPNIPKQATDKMAIYQLFLQHIIRSLKPGGKSAVVVPTGFITASGIDRKIREHLVGNKMLAGVVSMPSNIFDTTGIKVKDSKNQKTVPCLSG